MVLLILVGVDISMSFLSVSLTYLQILLIFGHHTGEWNNNVFNQSYYYLFRHLPFYRVSLFIEFKVALFRLETK